MKKSLVTQISLLLKNNEKITQIFVNTFIALSVLVLYMLLSIRFLPEGINKTFVTRFSIRIIILMIVLFFAFFLYFSLKRNRHILYKNTVESFYYSDVLLLLLPMTPIVQYIILNQYMLSFFDNIMLISIFLGLALILSFIIPFIFGIFSSRTVLIITGLSFSFFLFNMASMAADFRWIGIGSLNIQILIFSLTFIFLLFGYLFFRKILYTAVAVFFILKISISLISITTSDDQKSLSVDNSKAYSFLLSKDIIKTPDIFLLTYDSYVENETMLQYGINNSSQEDYLIKNGFNIYRGTYSVGWNTKTSMTSVLELRFTGHPKIKANGMVPNILKEKGYDTFGIFFSDLWFDTDNINDSVNNINDSVNNSTYKVLAKSIFEGEFRSDAGFVQGRPNGFSEKKLDVFRTKSNKPKFVYIHNYNPGHAQGCGKCRDNETKLYKSRLVTANKLMKREIDTLIKFYPNSIIIVNGDHGPRLTKTCRGIPANSSWKNKQYNKSEINRLDIQDRYGAFLAIKWPDNANIDHNKIEILQDIFPSVFAYLFENDSIYNFRMEQFTVGNKDVTAGVRVRNGYIIGGKDDGKLLFNSMKKK